ncbi:flagellar hook-basal body complex protein FliE [Bacillus testis]|uniref:flagellar hook-basal body complex protein FliE n=1 Tax=Bacillus testis TaxID=1622072 RepID=UPI00067E6F13|nr:flagellar hook-basal body complex protein FliE [Bacillus testis]
MAISGINLLNTIQQTTAGRTTPAQAQKTFSSMLKQSLNEVNATQIQSDALTNQLANGGQVDLHSVMIASQKANIMMQTTLEVRNKAVEAYQEMMRMQV